MKNNKLVYALLLAMTMSGCGGSKTSSTPATSSTSSSSISETISSSETNVLEELLARIIVVKNNQDVKEDFQVPGNVVIGTGAEKISVDIVWSTSDAEHVTVGATTESNGNKVTNMVVTQPSKGEEEAKVTLTATISYEGKEASKNFKVTVTPSESSADTWGTITDRPVNTWEEWANAANGTELALKGIVCGYGYASKYSNYNVFFQDENGGYYLYGLGMTADEMAKYCQLGNEIIVEGKKTTYNGLYEVSRSDITGVKVLSTGNEVAVNDFNESAKNGTLASRQSTYGTIVGTLVIEGSYKYLQVGANQYQLYMDEKYNSVNYAEIEEKLATFQNGDNVKVTGIVGVYTDPQVYPYDIEAFGGEITLTPEEKVASTLAASDKIEESYLEETVVNLPTSIYDDVTLTYSLSADTNTEVFALDTVNNTLTVTPTAEVNETVLTMSATCGEVSDSVLINLSASSTIQTISVSEALAIAGELASGGTTTDKYYVTGTLTDIYNTTYGNGNLTDGENTLGVYGMYSADGTVRYDAMETKPVDGDTVVLFGVLNNYNGKLQIKNAWVISFETPAA